MKTLWILAAAATFAACHNRSEDEMGAAPDRADSPAVQSGYDTTMAQPTPSPSTSGYDTTATTASPSAGMGTDSTLSPSAGGTVQADSAGTPQ